MHDELEQLYALSETFQHAYPEEARLIDFKSLSNRQADFRDFLHCFALISARLQHKIDQGNNDINYLLLERQIPTITQAQPSMSVIQIHDPNKQAYQIAKNSMIQLSHYPHCHFTTIFDTQVDALTINNIQKHNDRIEVSCANTQHNNSALPHSIRFYINNSCAYRGQLLYSLINKNQRVSHCINQHIIQHPWQYLMNYFHCPDQYFFIDVDISNTVSNSEFTINLKIDADIEITPNDLLLSCTPIINYFHKPTDPILLDPQTSHYDLSDNQLTLENIQDLTLSTHSSTIPSHSLFANYFQLDTPNSSLWLFNKPILQIELAQEQQTLQQITAHFNAYYSNGSNVDNYLQDMQAELQLLDYPLQIKLLRPLTAYHQPQYNRQQRLQLIDLSQQHLAKLTEKHTLLAWLCLLQPTTHAIIPQIRSIDTRLVSIRPRTTAQHYFHSIYDCHIVLTGKQADHCCYMLLFYTLSQYCPIHIGFKLTVHNNQQQVLFERTNIQGR